MLLLVSLPVILGLVTGTLSQSVSVELSNYKVNLGEDVTVRCMITDFEDGMFIYWWKKQADQETQVGTNNFVNDVFASTGRYTTGVDKTGDDVVFMLNIEGVEPEDAGELGCSIPTVGDSKQLVKLSVLTNPTNIQLFSLRSNETHDPEDYIKEYTDGEEVFFTEGDEYFFACTADGGSYPPAFNFQLGDRDVTEKFTTEEGYEMGDGQPGLKQIVYNGKAYTHAAVVVTKADNALAFTCTAGVPGWDTEAATIHIKPVLKFAPVITCLGGKDKIGADLYDNDIELSCVVKADPPVDYIKWTWSHEILHEVDGQTKKFTYNQTLGENEFKSHYSHHCKDGDNPDESISTFMINRAAPATFREYTIRTENELGYQEQTISFILDNPGALLAASSISVSTMLIATLAAIAVFFRL